MTTTRHTTLALLALTAALSTAPAQAYPLSLLLSFAPAEALPRSDEADGASPTYRVEAHRPLARQVVAYATAHEPGTIIIDTSERCLYLVLDSGRALRYGVGV